MPQSKPTHQLPRDFCQGQTPDVFIHSYHTTKASEKNQVQFSHHLLCLVLSGQKELHTGTEHVHIDPEQFFILKAGTCLMTERLSAHQEYSSILIFFSGHFLSDFCLTNKIRPAGKNHSTETVYTFPKDDFLRHYEKSIGLLPPRLLQEQNNLCIAKLEELLCYLLDKYPDHFKRFVQNSLSTDRELTLKQVVASHSSHHLSIQELAFLCHMSVSSFKRRFAEVYGCSPGKYFSTQRMQQAQQLLMQQKRPSEIYAELGYENLSAFSHEFKKHFGVAPKYYALQD